MPSPDAFRVILSRMREKVDRAQPETDEGLFLSLTTQSTRVFSIDLLYYSLLIREQAKQENSMLRFIAVAALV